MNNVSTFDFNTNNIRVITINGQPWFAAVDACRVLGLNNTANAVRPLDEAEKGIQTFNTPGGCQRLTTVSESGLYKLIMRSYKPEAKAFRNWKGDRVVLFPHR